MFWRNYSKAILALSVFFVKLHHTDTELLVCFKLFYVRIGQKITQAARLVCIKISTLVRTCYFLLWLRIVCQAYVTIAYLTTLIGNRVIRYPRFHRIMLESGRIETFQRKVNARSEPQCEVNVSVLNIRSEVSTRRTSPIPLSAASFKQCTIRSMNTNDTFGRRYFNRYLSVHLTLPPLC